MISSKNPEDDDPVLKAEMERALGPYMSLLPRDYIEKVLKPILRHALTEDAVGRSLLDRVRQMEQRAPLKSGEKTKEGVRVELPAGEKRPRGKR